MVSLVILNALVFGRSLLTGTAEITASTLNDSKFYYTHIAFVTLAAYQGKN